mgnify:CR=1 FL=1
MTTLATNSSPVARRVTSTIPARLDSLRWSRFHTLVIFALGNLASALAGAYPSLLLARFVAGLPHGAYFGVAALVAADESALAAIRRVKPDV